MLHQFFTALIKCHLSALAKPLVPPSKIRVRKLEIPVKQTGIPGCVRLLCNEKPISAWSLEEEIKLNYRDICSLGSFVTMPTLQLCIFKKSSDHWACNSIVLGKYLRWESSSTSDQLCGSPTFNICLLLKIFPYNDSNIHAIYSAGSTSSFLDRF